MYFLLDAAITLASNTTKTSFLLNSEIIAALIGGGFVIVGTLIGNHFATKAAKSQEQLRLLAEFYAEVFSTYTAAAPNRPVDKLYAFLAATEKTKLFCSPESEKILERLAFEMTESNADWNTCGQLIVNLRESAKKDLRQR